ncbi:hypothetical protein C9374_002344 [Naegleria lovaniensis]|uniref:Uncharacterized protein n=1 Tax=Naegleria lovaniensis TaxID=51637 RepID=A0AA88GPL2_NAELO|nr:uncharacterized protein C9374_002344 [Naegleria lovaniensis]KAG2386600.1 hypothetical protein C9374_002344 [Naegleria lovaniensis]
MLNSEKSSGKLLRKKSSSRLPTYGSKNNLKSPIGNTDHTTIDKVDFDFGTDITDEELYQKLKTIIKGENAEELLIQKKICEKIATSMNDKFSPEYIEEWKQVNLFHYQKLHQLGSDVKENMTDLSTYIYDVMAFKDVLIEYQQVLPYKLLQDLILLTSRLYRNQSDLFWNLSEFMTYVFHPDQGVCKQAKDISQKDLNYDFFSMRQLIYQYMEVKKELDISNTQLGDLRKHAESIITKRFTQLEKEVEFLRAENKFLKENTMNVENQTTKIYNELVDAFLNGQEALIKEIESDGTSTDESENIKNSKYNEELREMGFKLDSELKNAYSKILSIKDMLDNTLSQATNLKANESKAYQQLQAISVQLGTLAKKFDGKLQESVMTISKEIDKALEKKLKAAKRDLMQWKAFNKDASTKNKIRELLVKVRDEVTTLKDQNDQKEDPDQYLNEYILQIDSYLKQLILLATPNDFGRVPDETKEARLGNSDIRKPIRQLQQALTQVKYSEKGTSKMTKKLQSTVTLAMEKSDIGSSNKSKTTSKHSVEDSDDDSDSDESVVTVDSNGDSTSKVEKIIKGIEKITEDNKYAVNVQKKIQELEKKYVSKIQELEEKVKTYEETKKKPARSQSFLKLAPSNSVAKGLVAESIKVPVSATNATSHGSNFDFDKVKTPLSTSSLNASTTVTFPPSPALQTPQATSNPMSEANKGVQEASKNSTTVEFQQKYSTEDVNSPALTNSNVQQSLDLAKKANVDISPAVYRVPQPVDYESFGVIPSKDPLITNTSYAFIPSPLTSIKIQSSNGHVTDETYKMASNPLVSQLSGASSVTMHDSMYNDNMNGDEKLNVTQSTNPEDLKECIQTQAMQTPNIPSSTVRRKTSDEDVVKPSTPPPPTHPPLSPNPSAKKLKTKREKKKYDPPEVKEEPSVFPNEYGITAESVAMLPLITSLILDDPTIVQQIQQQTKKKEKSSLPYL